MLLEAKKNNPHSERHKPPFGTYDHFRYDNSGKCTVRQKSGTSSDTVHVIKDLQANPSGE